MDNEIKNRFRVRLFTTQADHRVVWLVALAIAVYILESALPSPLLGVKLGLANIIVIIVFLQFGWRMAVWVSLLRVLIGSLLIATFMTPSFFLSLSGALGSLLVLGLACKLPKSWALGPVGLCVLASLAHIICQFITAYLLFIPNSALFQLLPFLLSSAVVFGLLSGIITLRILNAGKAKLMSRPV